MRVLLCLSSKVETYMKTCFLVKIEDEIKTLFDNYFFLIYYFKKIMNIKKSTCLIDILFDKIYLEYPFNS